MELDIAIIGGGPAGSATALALLNQGNCRVGILERSRQSMFRIGESIAPSTQSLLARLGVFDSFLQDGHLPSLGNSSAWGSDTLGFNHFWMSMGGRGWHLNRARFDASLLQAAADRGAMVLCGSQVVGSDRSHGRWNLSLNSKDSPDRVSAEFVVDASGFRSVFARWQGVRTIRMDSLLGLAAVFDLDSTEAFTTDYTLIEAAPLGWWYAAQLPENRTIVTFMCDRDLVHQHGFSRPEVWMAALQQTHHIQHLIGQVTPPTKLQIQPAFSQYLEQASGDGWLAVGDAACKLDPLSAAGINKALHSGIEAADAIEQVRAGETNAVEAYHQKTQHQFELYLEDRRKYYAQETRWPSSPFWQRRQGRLTLSPATILSFETSPQVTARLQQLDEHFPHNDLQMLCQLCVPSQSASGVVTQFLSQATRKFSAYRPIEALQYLIEQQVIQAA